MSTSQLRDPLDRLVTRREAHAIAVKVLEQMLGAMAKAQQEYDEAPETTITPIAANLITVEPA